MGWEDPAVGRLVVMPAVQGRVALASFPQGGQGVKAGTGACWGEVQAAGMAWMSGHLHPGGVWAWTGIQISPVNSLLKVTINGLE